MRAATEAMQVTIIDRELMLRARLRERLERASHIVCAEHGRSVIAVTIHARENGWFDSMWTTCCDGLERQAAAILKERC